VAQVVRIDGGGELFVTPSACRASYERRTLPGETRAQVEGEVQAVLHEAARGAPDFRGRAELTLLREPFEVGGDARVVRLAQAEARRVLGREPLLAGAPYWTDAALLQAAGIPTLVLGPSGRGMHAADEYVELGSVAALESILDGVIAAFCA
jgi:acetylornithine deacetylase